MQAFHVAGAALRPYTAQAQARATHDGQPGRHDIRTQTASASASTPAARKPAGRWPRRDGSIVAEGKVAGLSALQMGSADGRERVHANFSELAGAVLAHGRPVRVTAGLTGFGGDGEQLQHWLAELLGIAPARDHAVQRHRNRLPRQLQAAARATWCTPAPARSAPGSTRDGEFHRAGGRGVVLDDGGGGFWIAREALRHIWRTEDEAAGQLANVADGARRVRPHRRQRLVAVAPVHLRPGTRRSRQAGAGGRRQRRARPGRRRASCTKPARELARLARALTRRFGPRPVVLAGRAAALHPLDRRSDARRAAGRRSS